MQENSIAREFLDEFFEYSLENGQTFAIWTKDTRQHIWATGPEDGAFIAEKFKGKDCYFSVGSYPAGTTRRTQDAVSEISGVWLDIDVGDKNNGRSYFPTMEEAVDWCYTTMAGMWSILVHSGGGLHMYLLFEDPLNTTTMDGHAKARALVRSFHSWAASRCPYDLDPVVDLSRVMRLPGTMNTAAGQPCQIIEQSGKRISWQDLEDLLPAVPDVDTGRPAEIDDVSEVPWEPIRSRIEMMASIDDKFRRTWTKARRFKDDSPSTYCMSLADMLCEAGFTNDEVLTALRQWRRLQCASEKPLAWYKATIAKAREQHAEQQFDAKFDATVTKALTEIEQVKEAEPAEEAEEEVKTPAVEAITAEMFQVPLRRVSKIITRDFHGIKSKPSYRLEFDGGVIEVESSAQLMSQGTMKQLLMDEMGIVMRTMKASKYDQILQIIMQMAEEEKLDDEANQGFVVASILEEILSSKIESAEVIEDPKLFEKNLLLKDEHDQYWASFDLIAQRYSMKSRYNASNKEIGQILRKLGSKPTRFGTRRLRLWLIPQNLTSEE